MEIKNKDIKLFKEYLMSIPLVGRKSAKRVRFVRMLEEKLLEVQSDYFELIKKHVKRDESGEPLKRKVGNQDVWDYEDEDSYAKEANELFEELFIIDNTNERKDTLLVIKDIPLNDERVFSDEDAYLHQRWCEIAETIQYDE